MLLSAYGYVFLSFGIFLAPLGNIAYKSQILSRNIERLFICFQVKYWKNRCLSEALHQQSQQNFQLHMAE